MSETLLSHWRLGHSELFSEGHPRRENPRPADGKFHKMFHIAVIVEPASSYPGVSRLDESFDAQSGTAHQYNTTILDFGVLCWSCRLTMAPLSSTISLFQISFMHIVPFSFNGRLTELISTELRSVKLSRSRLWLAEGGCSSCFSFTGICEEVVKPRRINIVECRHV